MVTINQRADVYVQHSLTKNGSYKFSIEAHDAGKINTASIRVDVLSLSPTTRRTTKITTSTTQETVPVKITTTREALSITTPLITTTKNPADGTTVESNISEVTASSSNENENVTKTNDEGEATKVTEKIIESTTGREEEGTTTESEKITAVESEENEKSEEKSTMEVSKPTSTVEVTSLETPLPETSTSGLTTEEEVDVRTTAAASEGVEEVTSKTTDKVLDDSTEDALFTIASDVFTDPQPSSTTGLTSTEGNAVSENEQETTSPNEGTTILTTTELREETAESSTISNEVTTTDERNGAKILEFSTLSEE
ncbi:unnamed protein product [Cylicostephanus goldi]|uniref:Uncharacterized protein n=1 Tax=Cylicostephanus goldi TaxID=71465 RepID=A0A3P7N3Z8_CYLGO|nr:unnamed protein product [Cylicostephanus goldi]